MSSEENFKFKIPPAITKYITPDASKEAKMMAAKGLVPMSAPILASVLTFFLNDTDPEIQTVAKESLLGMPKGMVAKIVQDQVHPKTLDFFAHEKKEEEGILEAIILNKLTTDETFVYLAAFASENLSTLIGNNQVRLMRTPTIAQELRKNPKALKSEVDRIVSFLRINGIMVEGESPELTQQEIKDILMAEDSLGQVDEVLPEVLVKETEEPLPEEKKRSLFQMVQTMTVAKKVKLALKGNKEARSLLIKDSNKIVATSVVKSPRITDGEVISIASMRSTHDEVIRIISGDPEWAKNYNLQVALANNPKTPFQISLKIIRTLRVHDLLKMSKNKNVAQQLSKIAKEMYETKRK